jgi:cell division septal protein FtsQ
VSALALPVPGRAMAKKQAKRSSDGERAKPAQPAWQRPPAHSRKQLQRTRRGQKRLASQTTPPAGPLSAHKPAQSGEASQAKSPRKLNIPVRAILRYGFLVVIAGALAYGMWELLRLPELSVASTSTEIGGAARISPNDIFAAADVEGRNVLMIRPGDIAARVREVPGIEKANVYVRLPNQVIIDVREYAPLVAWQGITTTVWLAENASEVPQAGAPPPLTLDDRTGMVLGESRLRWTEVLARLTELHRSQPAIKDIAYGEEQGLYYRTDEGWEVWLGDGGEIEQKLALLDGARDKIASAGVKPKVVDLRFGGEHALLR